MTSSNLGEEKYEYKEMKKNRKVQMKA